MSCKKDEEARVVNRLYTQATKHGRGEEWYARFLHYIKSKGMKPIEAASKAMRDDEVLTEIYL